MSKIIVFSGAGVSAESGLDTFRTEGGIWSKYDMDEVCNFNCWQQNYEKMHDFYSGRRAEITSVQPNVFHEAVARWSKEHEVINLTQNIDDLFERAGCENVIHLHGEHDRMTCFDCEHGFQHVGEWKTGKDVCPNCGRGSSVKPAVIFFGETAPRYLDLNRTIKSVKRGDIVIVAGSSDNVIDMSRMLPWHGFNVHVNPIRSLGRYDRYLTMSASEAVPYLDETINKRLGVAKDR